MDMLRLPPLHAPGPAYPLFFWRSHKSEGTRHGWAFQPSTRLNPLDVLLRGHILVSAPCTFVYVSVYYPPDHHDFISSITNIHTYQRRLRLT